METRRVYDPNERISLTLPARVVSVVLEVFHKNPNLGLSFDMMNEVIVEIHNHLQSQELRPQPEMSPEQTTVRPPPVVERRSKNSGVSAS